MGWPASDIALLGEYTALEPSPIERLEFQIANVAASYFSTRERPVRIERFLLFRNAWRAAANGRYTEEDLDILDSIDRIG